MATFTGTSWPGDRLEPGDERYECPLCQLGGYDETYLFYTCHTLATNRHPMWPEGTTIIHHVIIWGGCSQRLTQPPQWSHNGVHVDWGLGQKPSANGLV
eukprot:12411670-Karenia_brevis.AAC.1